MVGLAPTPRVRGGRAAANRSECYKTFHPSDLTFFKDFSGLENLSLLRILAWYVALGVSYFVFVHRNIATVASWKIASFCPAR